MVYKNKAPKTPKKEDEHAKTRSPLGKDLFQEAQYLGNVELHILEIEKVLVVLLLLQKVIDLEVHLQYSLFTALVMERDDEGSRCR